MGLFDVLEGVTKAVVGVVATPIDVAADLITLGGSLSDQEKPYTAQRVEKIMENLDKATKP